LSCTLFAVSFWRPDTPARRFASALSASAIIYLLTYVLFGVASDFRYAYWSICAAIAAFAALVCVKSAALESASPRVSRIKQCAENFVRRVRDRRTTLESTAWYLAIGVFNAIFYVLLGKALVTLGLGPSAAGILAFLPCAALSYLGHKYKTFRSSGAHRREAPRFALLFVIGVFCSAALPKLAQLAGLPVFWAFASVSAAVPVLNLIVMRYWIFGADT
jgi:putative flippase GtrA